MASSIKDPSVSPATRALRAVFSRPTVGILTTAVAIKLYMPHLQKGVVPSISSRASGLMGSALVGYGIGYSSMAFLQWVRWRMIKALLSYHGWLFDQKATSTKLWGLLLKLLVGPGPFKTFEFQDVLPSLPVPALEDTLKRYLTSVKPLLNPDEYEETVAAVEELKKRDGPILQKYILDRSRKTKNWLAEWWLTNAYLCKRDPIAINVNFMMTSAVEPKVSQDGLARSANILDAVLTYYEMIQSKTLPPDMIMGMIPVCMDGVRFMFGGCRVPGEHMDFLYQVLDSQHIVVISHGEYFRLNLYEPTGKGGQRRLTKRELKNQLLYIQTLTRDVPPQNKVAALTAQNRTKWAKDRDELQRSKVNAATLKEIETAVFILVLGHTAPQGYAELGRLALTGDGTNRWFDKSLTLEVYGGTTMGGSNMEHTGTDATHFAVMWEHCLQMDKFGPDGDIIDAPGDPPPAELPRPKKLTWDFTKDMEEKIENVYSEFKEKVDATDVTITITSFGRNEMKKMKVSPDGFLQMALQLAYYREAKEIVKTYEPASHRMFTLGRTENINPVSEHSVKFVKIMDDESISDEERISAMKAAISHQSKVRLECTAGLGCDRHMLGLLCAARELGMDIPKVFSDKAFSLEMKLSTSQVPTAVGMLGLPLVPESIQGGFGPACHDGYGVLYIINDENSFNMIVSSWRSCAATDSTNFAKNIEKAMSDMKCMLQRKK